MLFGEDESEYISLASAVYILVFKTWTMGKRIEGLEALWSALSKGENNGGGV